MEIRRFGPGHRRPDGPPGTRGVSAQVIHQDARGIVAELALGPHAVITPHSNPNTTYFIVISGGGFVQVGLEQARVSHGEAVLWPAGETHGAWTDGTEMRAIVVELAGADDDWARGVIGAGGAPRSVDDERPAEPAVGQLAERPAREPAEHDPASGEPW